MGTVPFLVLDNGQSLTENVAILSYLADLKPEKKSTTVGTSERSRATEWLAFGATEVHLAFGLIYGAEGFRKVRRR